MIFKGLYHEIRKVSPPEARSLILKVLTENNHNVSQTARILGISRDTVYRALRGPRETPHQLQDLILSEAKKTTPHQTPLDQIRPLAQRKHHQGHPET